jgi:CubicO group peptidase (beta-lactamase class C family)
VRASERSRPPGTGYAYSDLGYLLLGEVVRSVSGQTVAEFAAERIFGPLGMRDTGYLPAAELQPRLAATRCPDRQRVLLGEVHDGNCHTVGGVAGHAGLFGTAGDLVTYARMLLGGGVLEGVRVLSPLAVAQMGRDQNPPGLNGHSLGWFTRPNGYLPAGDFLPDDTFGHTGFTGTSLLICPSLDLAVVLLTNRVYQERDAAAFIRFRRRFHNAVASLVG